MMKHEFEKIAGYKVSEDDYNKIIEPMYNATDLDKFDFVKVIDRKRFEVKKEKTEEQKELENEINYRIKEAQKEIRYLEKEIGLKEELLSVETESEWIKRWKSDINTYKELVKMLRNRIKSYKWVLS